LPVAAATGGGTKALLEGIRVIDLTGALGVYCTKLLADMGADVIRVEPPEGDALRRQEPLIGGGGNEISPAYLFFNTNKHCLTLDLSSDAGRRRLDGLAAEADIVVQTRHEATAPAAEIDLGHLRRADPGLIHTLISAFGDAGPRCRDAANDLTGLAAGGFLAMVGDPDGPPLQVAGKQAYLAAGMYAAAATLIAVLGRRKTGLGAAIDVSMQEAVSTALETAVTYYDLEGVIRPRMGPSGFSQNRAGAGLFKCADGHVFLLGGGIAGDAGWERMVDWLANKGAGDRETLLGEPWNSTQWRATPEGKAGINDMVDKITAAQDRETLERDAQDHNLSMAAVHTVRDVLGDAHLKARGYYRDVDASSLGLGALVFPGPIARYSKGGFREPALPAAPVTDPAEIIRRLAPRPAAKPPATGAARGALPLDGLRVLDFSWVGAGPLTTRLLSDHGAEVIRVESETRPDQLRHTRPFKDGVPGLNRSGYYNARNAGKRSFLLNMKHPDAPAVALDLAAHCDVIINSFRTGVMERWGLGYDAVRERRPGILYVSMPVFGKTGPKAKDVGYGLTISAYIGLMHLTGYENGPPLGTGTNYPDHIPNPCHSAISILAALYRRQLTGDGMEIEVAQIESTMNIMGPLIVHQSAQAEELRPLGNSDPGAVPHGVFPCTGDDQWCAIAVTSDAQWAALVEALGSPEWAAAEEFRDLAGRTAGRAGIEQNLSRWTRDRTAPEIERALQGRGVAAAQVKDIAALMADEQLQFRRHWIRLAHPETGDATYEAPPFRFDTFAQGPLRSAPLIGADTEDIAQNLLDMDGNAYRAAIRSGLFS